MHGDLGRACSWADEIKSDHRWDWAKELHYISGKMDETLQSRRNREKEAQFTCSIDLDRDCANGRCVVQAIRNYTTILADPKHVNLHSEALLFLIHFVGDIHTPLHACGRLKGGNDYHVKFEGQTKQRGWNGHYMDISLHSLWDELLLDKVIREDYKGCISCLEQDIVKRVGDGTYPGDSWLKCQEPDKYTLGKNLDHVASILCPLEWSKDSVNLNCESIWVGVDGTNIDLAGEYYERNKLYLMRQIAKAGRRMAEMLDRLLDENHGHDAVDHAKLFIKQF